jgi:ribosomal protein S18 acetylase RimI-like enzyme
MTGMASSDKIIVSVAASEDVGDLVGLMEEFYAESNYPLDHPWAGSALLRLISRPEWGRIWLARSGGGTIGHAVLAVRYTMEHGGLSGYVDDLFVRPAFRRQGVGRALLDALFRECHVRGCQSVQVEVGPNNAPALALYAAFGLMPHRDDRQLLSGQVFDARA